MKISDYFKDKIVKEIKYAVKMMNGSPDPNTKLYYFSAVRGIFQRVFNIEYDSDLVYAEFITAQVLQAFMARLNANQREADRSVLLTEEHLKKLTSLTKKLARNIEKDEPLEDTMKKFVILLYSTTGNGYYLYEKGTLKI